MDKNKKLLKAIVNNNLNLVKHLLEHGADAIRIEQNGWSLLYSAIKSRSPEIVKLLLEHGADPTKSEQDGW